MNRLFEILFIFLILIGTSADVILRYYIPQQTIALDFIFGLSAATAGLVFYKIVSSSSWTTPDNAPQRSKALIHLTPFKNLVQTKDPLLVIRFFACFLVFITHMKTLLHPSPDLLAGNWFFLNGAAHSGMIIFFTLSGFLMGKAFLFGRYNLNRDGILDYYKSRWIRIFPLMFFVIVFLSALDYPEIIRFNLQDTIRLLTFNYYGNTLEYNGIGAMWSLSVEFQYYIIAPFVFSVLNTEIQKNKFRGIGIVLIFIAAFIGIKYFNLYAAKASQLPDTNFFSLLGNMPYFLTGFLFNYIPVKIPKKAAELVLNNWVLPIELSALYLWVCHLHIHSPFYQWEISLLAAVAIVLMDGLRHASIMQSKNKLRTVGALQVLGTLSYGFYLWHSAIGFVYARLFPNGFATHQDYLLETFIIGVIVLFVSLITFVLVEDRFNNYKPSYQHKNNGKRL